ncbi:hypothetical protein D3C85_1344570 [compost metagenome]
MRDTFTVQRGSRQDKSSQYHKTIALPDKAKIHQSTVEVHQHHTCKTENTADGFVIAKLVVLIDKVRQQHAEEGPGRVHDRAFDAGRIRKADIEERVLDGGLCQTQQRQLSKLPWREPGNGFALGQRKHQQQHTSEKKTIPGEDHFRRNIVGGNLE